MFKVVFKIESLTRKLVLKTCFVFCFVLDYAIRLLLEQRQKSCFCCELKILDRYGGTCLYPYSGS
jgi:hypothetical protein